MKNIRLLAAGTLTVGLIAGAVGSAFLMAGTTADRPVRTFEDFMADAEIYTDNGEYYKAVISYENALAEKDMDMEALSGLASVYYRQADYEEEERIRKQIEEVEPDNLENQIRLVEILIHNKEYDMAKQKTEELMKENDSEALKSLSQEMTVEAPVFNLTSGTYEEYQLLQITNVYGNASVHYTTDGTEPNADSPVYTDGIVLSYPENIIRAKAIGALGYESEEVQLNISISRPVERIELDTSDTLYWIASNIFRKSWNSSIYNYELAQIRSLYILGDYYMDVVPLEATFHDGYYDMYDSRYSDYGEHTLDFVEYTPFIKTLAVEYQQELDLSPLAQLEYIENLSLLNDGITDITALEGLTSLKQLALGWNRISNVSALNSLTGLESLGLWNNQISDLSMLSSLTGLRYFDVSGNMVSQIECMAQMPELTEVWINHNQIQDLSPLDACPKLMVLMQAGNPVTETGTLKERTGQFYKNDMEWGGTE